MPIERKLAAIMFTDIVGYTALSAKDSTKSSELLKTQRDTLKPIVEKHGGSWMKEMGDGLLLTFDSATSAVECSIAIQEATKDIDDLNLRIGIHEGEVIKQDGDVIGDDVNVASRIEPFSAVGGVAISQKIEQAISSNTEFETKYIGKPKLKGVSQKVEVYCITSHGLPKADEITDSSTTESKSNFNIFALTGGILTAIGVAFWIAIGVFDVSFGGKTEVPSVGILMMENLGSEEHEFWARGITEDLIVKIAGAGLIRVAPMKEILEVDIKESFEEIAKKLRVKYLLTSSIHRKQDGFDLRCQLLEAESGNSKYANKWSESIDNAQIIVGNLADNILKSLKIPTKQEIARPPTFHSEAYEYYYKAKYKFETRENMEDMEKVRELLRQAIALDQSLLLAKNIIGNTYFLIGDYDKAMEIYSDNLTKANKINDKDIISKSLNNIGHINKAKGNWDLALDYYERSLVMGREINNKHGEAITLSNIGNIYIKKGDYEKSLNYYEQAKMIDEELGNTSARWLGHLGYVYYVKGDYEKALNYYEQAKMIDEEFCPICVKYYAFHFARIYLLQGYHDKALDYFEQYLIMVKRRGNKKVISDTYSYIGRCHMDKGNWNTALDYYERALEIDMELRNMVGIASELSNIGNAYYLKWDLDKALDYQKRALVIESELKHKIEMSMNYAEIGDIYIDIGDYDTALDNYERALEIERELGNKIETDYIISILGYIYFKKTDYEKAEEPLELSLANDKEIGLGADDLLWSTTYLYLTYKHRGKHYDVKEIHKLIKKVENIEFDLNYHLCQLLEDTSYLETAYNQIQEIADNLEPDIKAKFLSYPIPKAIVEEWEKVK